MFRTPPFEWGFAACSASAYAKKPIAPDIARR